MIKYIKQLFLCTMMFLAMSAGTRLTAQAAIASGNWKTCTWEIDDESWTLTIRPTNGVSGTLKGETSYSVPWSGQRMLIKKIVIGPGVKADSRTYQMFYDYQNCTEMDLSNLDVSDVTDMEYMFANCYALTDLNVSGWDVGNVQKMSFAFQNCRSLTSLNISDWDTGSATSMSSLFDGCSSLENIDVSNWNTTNVKSISGMFYGCEALESLDLSNWDTSNVMSMNSTFRNCTALSELNISSWNTDAVTNIRFMFLNSPSLKKIHIGENFSFAGNGITGAFDKAILPTPPTSLNDVKYTQKWIMENGNAGPYTPEELRDNYDGTMAGTWVWEIGATPITVQVTKVWSDANDKNGIRPEEIDVALTDSRSGEPELVVDTDTSEVMTRALNATNNWMAEFTNVPFHANSVLSVVELDENGDPAEGSSVDGYELFVTGDEINGYEVEGRYISDNVINTVFQKYLLLDANANVPNKTFTYTVTPGQARSYDLENGKFEVYAGIGQPTVGQAVFSPSMTTYNSKQNGDMVELGSGQKYAKAGVAIDFTGISFPEPGVYRYVLTENEGSDDSVDYDVQKPTGAEKNIRILDVYVNNTHGERDEYNWPKADYTVAGMVLHANDDDVRMGENNGTVGGTLSDKSDGYVNAFSTVDLTVGKEVDGNQASRDKYFAVTVTLENAIPGTVYSVDLTDADARISANPTSSTTCITENVTQPERLTVGNDGSVQQVFYLQGGQKVVIRGIEPGTKYTVSENEEDYKPSIAVEGDTTNNEADDIASVNGRQVSDKSLDDTTVVTLTNTRDGVIPTGTHSAMIPFIMLAVIGGLGLFVRRRETL